MKRKILVLVLVLLNTVSLFCQTWESFTKENSGLPDNTVNSITISSDNAVWFATDNGLASYKNNTWKVFGTEEGLSSSKLNFISFLPVKSESLWVASNSGATVLRVDINNEINDPKYITKANEEIVSDSVNVIDIDGQSSSWIGTDKGLSVITNSGVYNFTKENGFDDSEVSALKKLPDDWVHVGTAGDGVNRMKYNGVDGITSASKIITTWSGLISDSVLAIYVTDDTLRWYGTPKGVSTHHGEDTKDINNWWVYNTYTSGIIDDYVRAIVRDNEGNMWFGTRKGLSKLSSDESTWQSFTEEDGLVGNNIYDLAVDEDNGIWVATDKGVSHYPGTPSSVNSSIAVEYKINITNYPNPFNPSTTIEYTVPAIGSSSSASLQNVILKVYDALGNEIAVLINEQQSAGTYKVVWDATEFSSGIYYYKIYSDAYSKTGKMLLLK